MNRTFGQLCLLQHMSAHSGIGRSAVLMAVLRSYPAEVSTVPISHMGAPSEWASSTLWAR